MHTTVVPVQHLATLCKHATVQRMCMVATIVPQETVTVVLGRYADGGAHAAGCNDKP